MPRKLLSAGSVLLLGMLWTSCAADTHENATTYEITIPADNDRVAIVTASLTPADREFYMYPGANQLPISISSKSFAVACQIFKSLRASFMKS